MSRILVVFIILASHNLSMYSQQQSSDIIVYMHRMKKSTNSDKDYQLKFNDKLIGTFEGVNPAISAQSKGQWIVSSYPSDARFHIVVADKKGNEIDRLALSPMPAKPYFIEFNPAAGYGVKALNVLTVIEGRKLFAEASKDDIKITTPAIAATVWAEKSKAFDDEADVSTVSVNQGNTSGNPDGSALAARSTMNVETSLGTNFQPEINNGKYYALVIGIQDYLDPSINDLDQPVKDAEGLVSILTNFYTFDKENIIFLKNPKRQQITKSLDELLDKVSTEDNLIIFYAGHGHWDEKLKQGYWLASDATAENRGTWFSNADLKTYIGGINARHTLLITDACFGGSIFKTREAFLDANTDINELYKYPSRKAMTSGALSAVPDKSVFVQFLTKRLEQNKEKYVSAEQIFSSFKTAVINNSANSQIPQYGEIRETGDEGGDFIFIRK
jgi:hypothetical protein